MSVKHYYTFANSRNLARLDQEAWDKLRTGTDNPAFQFESSVEEYEASCVGRTDCREVAKEVRDVLKSLGKEVSCVVSLGTGKGIVEWHLKRLMPEMRLICTDYAESGVESLRRLFRGCDQVMTFDMLKSNYDQFPDGTVLFMNRISTEFTTSEWLQIFRSCRDSGIKHVIFIPTELASFKLKVMETLRHFVRKLLRRKDTFCGGLYSKRELEKLLSFNYGIKGFKRMGNSAVYQLEKGA